MTSLVGLIIVGLAIAQRRRTSRASIKSDLEILKLMKESGLEQKKLDHLKRHIVRSFLGAYGEVPADRLRRVRGLAAFIAVVFGWATWHSTRDGFSVWSVVTGMYSFLAVLLFVWAERILRVAITAEDEKKEERASVHAEQPPGEERPRPS